MAWPEGQAHRLLAEEAEEGPEDLVDRWEPPERGQRRPVCGVLPPREEIPVSTRRLRASPEPFPPAPLPPFPPTG